MLLRWLLFAGPIIVLVFPIGCSSALPRDEPIPLRHGRTCDVEVAHPYVGGREIANALCAAIRTNAHRCCCLSIRVTAPSGRVLGVANRCGAPDTGIDAWQLKEAHELLISCLEAVENWDSPHIEITADEAGTVVLAGASICQPTEIPPVPYFMARPLRMFSETHPLYLKVAAEGERRTERLLEKSIMLYYNAQHQAANVQP